MKEMEDIWKRRNEPLFIGSPLHRIYDEDYISGKYLSVGEPYWDDRYLELIEMHKITSLLFNSFIGWKQTSYDFLTQFADRLKGLHIVTDDKIDLSPIKKLKNLELFSLHSGYYKNCPDFSKFLKLKSLSIPFQATAKSLYQCKGLEVLRVARYPHEDIEPLSHMKTLNVLQISTRKLSSLNGLMKLEKLRHLDLMYASKLEHLDGIENCSDLELVELFNCGKVRLNPEFSGTIRKLSE